jgi:hypothetical protein
MMISDGYSEYTGDGHDFDHEGSVRTEQTMMIDDNNAIISHTS